MEKQDWATMPGKKEPNRKVAEKCAKLLMKISAARQNRILFPFIVMPLLVV